MTQQHQQVINQEKLQLQWQELHQIFYPCNKFDTIDKLCLLEPFYFSTKSTIPAKPREEKEKEKEKEKKIHASAAVDAADIVLSVVPPLLSSSMTSNTLPKPKQCPDKPYYPHRKNALFWCVYIQTQGLAAYYAIPRQKLSTVELAEQIKIAEFLGTSSSIGSRIERPRITKKLIQELRSDLMVFSSSSSRRDAEQENPLRFLVAYSLYYDVKITVWIQPRLYFEIGPSNAANGEVVIVRDNRGNFGVISGPAEKVTDASIRMESWDKPLRPMTHYKVEELIKMLETMDIAIPEDCKKKADLYALLLDACKK
jgi:hypothetical protein